MNQKALEIISTMFCKKKFINVAELTEKYSQKELNVLIQTSNIISELISKGAKENILAENFGSNTNAFIFKAFVETQKILFNRAVLYNQGAIAFGFRTIENGITESILHQN